MKLEVKDVCFSYQDGESKKEIFNWASCDFLDKKFCSFLGEYEVNRPCGMLIDGLQMFHVFLAAPLLTGHMV